MSRSNPIQVQKYLSGVAHPVLAALEKLPERDYHGPNAVSAEVSNA
jgi:hypothetical protein